MFGIIHLILEIENDTIFQPCGLQWIEWHNKCVVGEHLGSKTRIHYVELDFLQITIDVSIKNRESSTLILILCRKLLRRRLIGWSIILRSIIAGDAHFGC